jgi:hypothetical protein
MNPLPQHCTRMRHSCRLSQAAILGVSFFNGSGFYFSTEATRGALVGPVERYCEPQEPADTRKE